MHCGLERAVRMTRKPSRRGSLPWSWRSLVFGVALAGVALLPLPLAAQHHHHGADETAPRWTTRYGGLHVRVGTHDAEAQRLFDQGLLLVYSFSHKAAAQAFVEATRRDPGLAMAHWGVALSMRAYINAPFTGERYRRGREAALRAHRLRARASAREQAYIQAIQFLYEAAPADADHRRQQQRYAAAMRQLADRYPDDLDAATLAMEARMTLNPWRLWNENGRPADGTAEIVDTLESVLRRNPDHVGANHLLIHALEASPTPERALAAAIRLDGLDLDTGHLAHMPGHIYLRLGDYANLVRSNRNAVEADEAFLAAEPGEDSVYTRYHLHNLDFVVVGETERGNWAGADQAARQFDTIARRLVPTRPGADYLLTRRVTVLVLFERWEDVLALDEPAPEQPVARAYFAYARGVAHAALGNIDRAQAAARTLDALRASLPASATFRGNDARQIMAIASHVLQSRIATAQGRPLDAIASLQLAVALQDGLRYEEPPSWDFPLRELLGRTWLQAGDAARAEGVFRDNLIRYPRHPRTLAGLRDSLEAQGLTDQAALVAQQWRLGWMGAGS